MRVLFFLFLLLPVAAFTQSKRVMQLKDDFKVKEGKEFVEYYLSTDTGISPMERYQAMKEGSEEMVPRYLFFTTQSQKWLFFRVNNPRQTPVDLLIEMGDFGLSSADYYVFQADSMILEGFIAKRGGLRTGTYYDRKIIIPFQAAAGTEYAFLINVETSAPLFGLPVIFWNKRTKMNVSQGIEFGRGLFYGVLAFFIMVTGMVVYLIRQRSYLYYWLYLSMGGMLLVLKSGIPLEVFWPGRSYFDFIVSNLALFAYLIVTLQFLKEFLSYRTNQRWHVYLMYVLMGLGIVLLVAYLPFAYFRVAVQDAVMIVQTVYVNVVNLAVVAIIFYFIPRVSERFTLIVALLYYLIFSAYLFNPFIEFGFWTGRSVGHIIIYSGGLAIGVLLTTITALRVRAVFEKNREMKLQLSELNRNYSYSLIEGQEKERRRVAEELHDGIGAHLSAVKMKLSAVLNGVSSEEEKETLQEVIVNLDESCQHVRELSHELMPPSLIRFGIGPSLKDMLSLYQQKFPIRLSLKTNVQQVALDAYSQVVLYRLMHSLLQALLYSHCQYAEIRLFIFPSVEKAGIQVKYIGGVPIKKDDEILSPLRGLVDLLQGRLDTIMSNVWDDEINIEIPVKVVKQDGAETD